MLPAGYSHFFEKNDSLQGNALSAFKIIAVKTEAVQSP